jgi:hypothetical protein
LSHLLEPGLKESGQGTPLVFFGGFIYFGKVLTSPKGLEEFLRLGRGGLEGPSLEKNDRPGKNGEEEKDEQDQLDNKAGVRD